MKTGPKKHYVIEWGVSGVKKYTSKEHAVRNVCQLLQRGEPTVAVYFFYDYEADLWSYEDRHVERYILNVMPDARLEYLLGRKPDLFS